MDIWFSETELHASGSVERAIERARAAGYVEERDGATWLRTTAFGDDKDRVVVRSDDGVPTYLGRRPRVRRPQDRPRPRAPAVRARRRPPRLHQAAAGDRGRPRARPRDGRGAAVPDDHGLRRAHGQAPRQRGRASTSSWTRSAWTRRATSSWRARTTSRWTSTSTSPSSSRARTRSTTCSTPTRASAASCARSWRRASRSRPTRRATSRSGRSARSSSGWRSGRGWCGRRPSGARRIAWWRGCTTWPADFHVVHHDLLVLRADPVVRGFRLALARATGDTIRSALALIGVEAPDAMHRDPGPDADQAS